MMAGANSCHGLYATVMYCGVRYYFLTIHETPRLSGAGAILTTHTSAPLSTSNIHNSKLRWQYEIQRRILMSKAPGQVLIGQMAFVGVDPMSESCMILQ